MGTLSVVQAQEKKQPFEVQIEDLRKDYLTLSQLVQKVPKTLVEQEKRTQQFVLFEKKKKHLETDTGGMTKFLDGNDICSLFFTEIFEFGFSDSVSHFAFLQKRKKRLVFPQKKLKEFTKLKKFVESLNENLSTTRKKMEERSVKFL